MEGGLIMYKDEVLNGIENLKSYIKEFRDNDLEYNKAERERMNTFIMDYIKKMRDNNLEYNEEQRKMMMNIHIKDIHILADRISSHNKDIDELRDFFE